MTSTPSTTTTSHPSSLMSSANTTITDFEADFKPWIDNFIFSSTKRGRNAGFNYPHFQIGSTEYEEFWKFARQYTKFMQSKKQSVSENQEKGKGGKEGKEGKTDKTDKTDKNNSNNNERTSSSYHASTTTPNAIANNVTAKSSNFSFPETYDAKYKSNQLVLLNLTSETFLSSTLINGTSVKPETKTESRYFSHSIEKSAEANSSSSSSSSRDVRNISIKEWFQLCSELDDISSLTTATSSSSSSSLSKLSSPSASQLSELRTLLSLFENFLQKQRYLKALKTQSDRTQLPIYQSRELILQTIAANQVVVIAADTAAGKSTQVPQFLLEAGYSMIACTQPRRIACISLCHRVSYETLTSRGSTVAYQIRFEDTKSRDTRILFLTEGLLLRQISGDPLLERYNVVIVDEVHERHLSSDFLLGILRYILPQRPDLKLILMSATINIDLFSGYFGGCPIVRVPGRLYPVTVEYDKTISVIATEASLGLSQKLGKKSKSEKLDPTPYIRILEKIDNSVKKSERGDVLIFLSGMSDIIALAEQIKIYAQQTKSWIVLLLHSALSIEEQDRVFDIAPPGFRKCILSTNISETSVTIDGIRFVIDSGKVKEMAYDPECKMQRLQTFTVSQASAEQRKGRAGRTGPGICYRLYTKQEYEQFPKFAVPEIQRVPLESVLLQVVAMGGDPRSFSFIENPTAASIETAMEFLQSHGAIDKKYFQLKASEGPENNNNNSNSNNNNNNSNNNNINNNVKNINYSYSYKEQVTPLGKVLSRLPVDLVIGKMLILGTVFDLIDPVVTLAATLTISSPFQNSVLHQYQMQQKRTLSTSTADSSSKSSLATASTVIEGPKAFFSAHGDAFTLLNVYYAWLYVKTHSSSGESSRRWCKKNGLEEKKLYEISKLRRQFFQILEQEKLVLSNKKENEKNNGTNHDDVDDEEQDNSNDKSDDSFWNSDFISFSGKKPEKAKRGYSNEQEDENGEESIEKARLKRQLFAARRQQNSRKQRLLRPEIDDNEIENNINNDDDDDGGGGAGSDGGNNNRDDNSSDGSNSASNNLDHLEFKLNTKSNSKDFTNSSSHWISENGIALSYEQLSLLKAIIANGLYPHFALPDANNLSRKDSDQVFHTKNKLFALVHPQSVFASDPQLLFPDSSSQEVRGIGGNISNTNSYGNKKTSHSQQQQQQILLCYVSLLETNKPYLVNTTALPSLQALCLSCQQVVVSKNCKKLVFDRWIEVRFPNETDGVVSLCRAYRIRELWNYLLAQRLQSSGLSNTASTTMEEEGAASSSSFLIPSDTTNQPSSLQTDLSEPMFLNDSNWENYLNHPSLLVTSLATLFSQIKELKTDLAILVQVFQEELASFIGDTSILYQVSKAKQSELEKSLPPKNDNGFTVGERLSSWLIYNGFILTEKEEQEELDSQAVYNSYGTNNNNNNSISDLIVKTHWECSNCQGKFIFTQVEKEAHSKQCHTGNNQAMSDIEDSFSSVPSFSSSSSSSLSSSSNIALVKDYYCKICQKSYNFTSTDILKHKQTHK